MTQQGAREGQPPLPGQLVLCFILAWFLLSQHLKAPFKLKAGPGPGSWVIISINWRKLGWRLVSGGNFPRNSAWRLVSRVARVSVSQTSA